MADCAKPLVAEAQPKTVTYTAEQIDSILTHLMNIPVPYVYTRPVIEALQNGRPS
jgi:hypothetical protein